jgi:hypothetical protein
MKQMLQVIIAYHDLGAGRLAMDVMAEIGKGLEDEIEFQPVSWSFDLLADMDWGEAAARDAAKVDILIIAMISPDPVPPAVRRWAEATISRKRGSAVPVVALFGPEKNPDGAVSSRLETVQAAAQRAGLDFFAPTPRQGLDEAIARIHPRAEMVGSLPNKILTHLPVPRREQHTEVP